MGCGLTRVCGRRLLKKAAEYGRLEIIKYMHNVHQMLDLAGPESRERIKWDFEPDTINAMLVNAAHFGQARVVAWGREHGFDTAGCEEIARERNHAGVVALFE